jgi:hypothetical protein
MHATKLVTPEMMLIMAVGLLAFIIIYRMIFRKKK